MPGFTADEVLALAAAVEADSDHPIALAVMRAGESGVRATDVHAPPGVGVTGLLDGHRIAVGKLDCSALPGSIEGAVTERCQRGETMVAVEKDHAIVGVIAIATPLRPEALAAVRRLQELGSPRHLERGQHTGGPHRGNRAGDHLRPRRSESGRKVDALTSMRRDPKHVLMVGDGVNDAPALAAADVGCAIGSGSEAALANSDVALLGNDLQGVPAALGIVGSTYTVILQNFGWAMGYNAPALPLAAFGLLDPLVAAIAMGLSSVLVVLNSLRLARLGRSGVTDVRPPRMMRGRRGVVVSVLLPVVLFAGLTVVSELISPARDNPSSPSSPLITTLALPHGGSVEIYLDPGGVGVDQLHLIFNGSEQDLATVKPLVVARVDNGSPQVLRQFRVAAGHYSDIVLLTPGRTTFLVRTRFGGAPVSFEYSRTVP